MPAGSRQILAFILAVAAACAASFAFDLMAGAPSNPLGETIGQALWGMLALIVWAIAWWISPRNRWLSVPFLFFAVLALLGVSVGHQSSVLVTLAQLFLAYCIWISGEGRRNPS